MMRAKKPVFKHGPHEKGMILAVATMVVVVMLIMAVPFLFKLSAQYRTTEKGFKSNSAFELAEAGIDRALWEMNRPFAFDGGLVWNEAQQGSETIANLTGADGTVIGDINIQVSSPSGGIPDTRFIEATGLIRFIGDRTVNRVVRVNLEKYFKSIWDFGFFADTDVYVRTNILIDSYNSNNGAYGTTNRGNEGHIGTNGTQDNAFDINQGSSSAIYGNVASGVGSEADNMTNIINLPSDSVFKSYTPDTVPVGERSIMTSTFEMPSVDVSNLPPRAMFNTTYDFSTWFTSDPDPSAPLASSLIAAGKNKGAYAPGQGNFTLTATNSGVYTSMNLNKSNITISGNVALYVTGLDGATGGFSMSNNSTITVGPDSSLTLILGKTTYYQANNTSINNTTAASNLVILGTDQFTGTMNYKCNSANKAAIYVPRAEFMVENSNTHIYGAVVCRRFNFPVNINLHYDEALADLTYVKGGIPYWKLTSWQERMGAGGN